MTIPSETKCNKNLLYRNRMAYLLFGSGFIVFSGFVYQAEVPQVKTMAPAKQVAHGKMLWQKHNCSSCHQLYGLGGYLGPDLTNVISAEGKGKMYAAAVLKTGTKVMPDFKLKQNEVDALLAFLEHTDKSGSGSVHAYQIETDGSITPKYQKEKSGL